MLRLLMALMLMTSCVALAATPEGGPTDDSYAKELESLQATSTAGQAETVSKQLGELREKLVDAKAQPEVYAGIMQKALRIALSSPVAKNKEVRDAAAKQAIDTLLATKAKCPANPALLQQHLELILELLPRTNADPEHIAKLAMDSWGDMLTAKEHYAPYDPANPQQPPQIPQLPPDFNEPFTFGMDPADIVDPVFRKQYEDYLHDRDEFNRMGSKFIELSAMQEHFFATLKDVIKTAFSGSPEKKKAGTDLIEAAGLSPFMSSELLKVID